MGLDQRKPRHEAAHRLRGWALPGLVIIVSSLLALSGEWGREMLRYDRDAIAGGELWRLVSGHFVHLGLSHWVYNGVGLSLIWILVGQFLRSSQWLLVTCLSILCIDAGFWILEPQLQWYVGLSGVQHGYLAAGILAGFRERRVEMAVLGAVILAKLVYEQLIGPMPGSEFSSGGAVVTAAHLYGAIGGLIAIAILRIRARRQRSI
ncbi:MAG: rhombosortase [Gammaproteobacteria bacterium]|nr:rhombosortase [Gammaproteobacteria bacterium]MDH3416968.1 rhombosortase [Gammaproteobacteria bacterium]